MKNTRNSVGRPALPMNKKKCHLVAFVVNHRQWLALRRAVKNCGVSFPVYMRELLDVTSPVCAKKK